MSYYTDDSGKMVSACDFCGELDDHMLESSKWGVVHICRKCADEAHGMFAGEPTEDAPVLECSLDRGAYIPERAHADDAGLDLRTPVAVTLGVCDSVTIDTGVHVSLPPGLCGLIVSKSGLNVRHGITSTGLIDPGYSGSIAVKLYNRGEESYRFEVGDKVSQLLILPFAKLKPVEVNAVEGGERGDGGFGSTGR